jgi:hypothetical protein
MARFRARSGINTGSSSPARPQEQPNPGQEWEPRSPGQLRDRACRPARLTRLPRAPGRAQEVLGGVMLAVPVLAAPVLAVRALAVPVPVVPAAQATNFY